MFRGAYFFSRTMAKILLQQTKNNPIKSQVCQIKSEVCLAFLYFQKGDFKKCPGVIKYTPLLCQIR